jgi:LysR family transcriptional regulator, cell division regulator
MLVAIMKINTFPAPSDILYFQEVAQTQNLSRAAERLAVSQPALSLSLKRLEEQLNTKLFVRKSNGLALTESGKILMRQCQSLLSCWQSVVAETTKSDTELIGRFRLGCHPSVAMYALRDVIGDIYRRHEQIEIQLVHGLSRVISEQVITGQIEFGYVINPIQHPDLVINRMAQDEVSFWKTAGAPDDVLIYDPALVQSQSLMKKTKKKHFRRSVLSDNLEVVAMLARSGAGVAILPGRVARAVESSLKPVKALPSFQDELALIYRSDTPKTLAMKTVLQMLKGIKL